MKSGNLNFLEPSGPLQDCNGTALPLPLLNPLLSGEQTELYTEYAQTVNMPSLLYLISEINGMNIEVTDLLYATVTHLI